MATAATTGDMRAVLSKGTSITGMGCVTGCVGATSGVFGRVGSGAVCGGCVSPESSGTVEGAGVGSEERASGVCSRVGCVETGPESEAAPAAPAGPGFTERATSIVVGLAKGVSARAISAAVAKRSSFFFASARATTCQKASSMSWRIAVRGTGASPSIARSNAVVEGASNGLRPAIATYMHAPSA